jgi:hypothetical protein
MRFGQPARPGDFDKIEEEAGPSWSQEHLDYYVRPLYGNQEGVVVSYNPHKPWRPLHSFHGDRLQFALGFGRRGTFRERS